MEKPEFESIVERWTPEVEWIVTMGRMLVNITLNYDNTAVVMYEEPYEDFDHVYCDADETDKPIFAFRNEDGSFTEAEELMNLGFAQHYEPYPDETVEKVWWKHQRRMLSDELKEIENL